MMADMLIPQALGFLLLVTLPARACGACAFAVLYPKLPQLPLWIVLTAIWWVLGTSLTSRLGLRSRPGCLTWTFALALLAISLALLGPLPLLAYLTWKFGLYLGQLVSWRRGRLSDDERAWLRYENLLWGGLLVTSLYGYAADRVVGPARVVGRVMHPIYEVRVQQLQTVALESLTDTEIESWLKQTGSRLQENALLVAWLKKSPHLNDWLKASESQLELRDARAYVQGQLAKNNAGR